MVTHLTIEQNQKESKYLYEFVACRTTNMIGKGSYVQDNVVASDGFVDALQQWNMVITKLMRI